MPAARGESQRLDAFGGRESYPPRAAFQARNLVTSLRGTCGCGAFEHGQCPCRIRARCGPAQEDSTQRQRGLWVARVRAVLQPAQRAARLVAMQVGHAEAELGERVAITRERPQAPVARHVHQRAWPSAAALRSRTQLFIATVMRVPAPW